METVVDDRASAATAFEELPFSSQFPPLSGWVRDRLIAISLSAIPATGEAAAFTDESGWQALPAPPLLQQPSGAAGPGGYILVGLACDDAPPCDLGQPTVAWLGDSDEAWQVATLGAERASAETFYGTPLGSDGATAWALTEAGVWEISNGNADVVVGLPPGLRLMCLGGDQRFVALVETGPESTNEQIDAGIPRPLRVETASPDGGAWQPVDGSALDPVPEAAQPGCIGESPVLAGLDSVFTWSPAQGWDQARRPGQPGFAQQVATDRHGNIVILSGDSLQVYDRDDKVWQTGQLTKVDGVPPARTILGDYYVFAVRSGVPVELYPVELSSR